MGLIKKFFKKVITSFQSQYIRFRYAFSLFKLSWREYDSYVSDRIDSILLDQFFLTMKDNLDEIKRIIDAGDSNTIVALNADIYKNLVQIYEWHTVGMSNDILEINKLSKEWIQLSKLKVETVDGQAKFYNAENDENVNKIKREEIRNIREQLELKSKELDLRYRNNIKYIFSNRELLNVFYK